MTTSRSPDAAERKIVPEAPTMTRTATGERSESSTASAPDCSTVVVVPSRIGAARVPRAQAVCATPKRIRTRIFRFTWLFPLCGIPEKRIRSSRSSRVSQRCDRSVNSAQGGNDRNRRESQCYSRLGSSFAAPTGPTQCASGGGSASTKQRSARAMATFAPMPWRFTTRPPVRYLCSWRGAVAQLGEHLVCNQGVVGSNPIRSMWLGSELDYHPLHSI